MTNNHKVIAFDADDTLWVNENYFREAEEQFVLLLNDYGNEDQIMKELYDVEMKNLDIYGFGIKGFMLAMVEAAHRITNGKASSEQIYKIIELGKQMLSKPVELLADVETILKKVQEKYKVILATKGDLLDQHRKLSKSGLERYFHHIEVMNNKKERDYKRLLNHLDIQPHEFLMIGNSLKSDILPVVNIGGSAIYVPYEITWMHEEVTEKEKAMATYHEVEKLSEILQLL